MIPAARSRIAIQFCNRIALPSRLAGVLLLLAATSLSAQVVATYSFEDGKADGWTSFYYASTPVATTAAAYSGKYSLLTSTSSTGTGGPSIDLAKILLPGAKYTITGYVELASGESASDADFSMKRTDPSCSGGVCYDAIGSYQVPVTASGWVQIGGAYTVSSTATDLLLYAQLVGATTAQSFYLDEVVITETAPPPSGKPIATYTFKDGELDGWAPYGTDTLTNAVPPIVDPHGDARGLFVSGRKNASSGAALNLLKVNNVVAGAVYQVSAYVLLGEADSTNPTASITTKASDCAYTAGLFNSVATSAALSHTAWTKVQGTFSFNDVPATPTGLLLVIATSSPTDTFYVDDIDISELSPAPLSQSQQDNSGISTTFENGGLDGWSSRSGSSTLTNSTAEAHSGAHSLLITSRAANWDGPQINVSDKMYNGSIYNLSVWVRMQPTDNLSHVINMSLQTTLQGTVSYTSVSGYPGLTVLADGKWHQISATAFNMSNPYDTGTAYLYLQTVPTSGNDLVSFYIDDFKLTYVAPPTIQTDIPSIYKTFADYFPIGAAIDLTDMSGPHAELLARNFKSMTPGNDMKWASVENTFGVFTYANADEEVGFAECHDMLVRGHNLVWAIGEQTPSYATGDGTNSAANQAKVTANIQEHIKNEVEHFGAKVYAWDVVNEPLDPTQSDCLVHGPFYQVLGKSYIDIALKAAREYAPKGTKLFINDYSTSDPNRLACLVKVVQDLRDRGIPLDAIGHETHDSINYPSTAAIVNAINTMAEKFPDLEQQVTELDESVYKGGDDTSNYGNDIPPSVLSEQGWLYAQYFDAFRKLKGKLAAVTFWGMADDDTWLDSFPVDRTDYPLPFNMRLQAKPAYWGVVDPTHLPGAGMTFALTEKGTGNTRTWTITATNGKEGTAYAVNLSGFKLSQTAGTACKPAVTPHSKALGNIAESKSVSAAFTVNFTGCPSGAKFNLSVPWNSATYDTGTFEKAVTF